MMRASLLATAVLALAAPSATAQQISASAQQRLERSLDAETYRAVRLVFDSARARGLPVGPLVSRALEATLRPTPGPVVRDAVTRLADRLDTSRSALGPGSSETEIAAGAGALGVGAPREALVQIRAASPRRPVTVPLGVLTELIVRRVKADDASAMVVALMRKGATPAQLVSLSDDVARDVNTGIAPGAAFDIRTRSVLGTLEQVLGDGDRLISGPGLTSGRAGPATTSTRAPRKP